MRASSAGSFDALYETKPSPRSFFPLPPIQVPHQEKRQTEKKQRVSRYEGIGDCQVYDITPMVLNVLFPIA
jgi:hypothetical protein